MLCIAPADTWHQAQGVAVGESVRRDGRCGREGPRRAGKAAAPAAGSHGQPRGGALAFRTTSSGRIGRGTTMYFSSLASATYSHWKFSLPPLVEFGQPVGEGGWEA